MADLKRIKDRIAELAGRPKNVELSEIEWIVNHLGNNGYNVSIRKNVHSTMFRVNKRQFGVCHHNPGNKQIKACYVSEFLDAMADVGVYEN